jgi:hypothetical protein
MPFPLLATFGVLLVLYMACSLWARLDPRYLIAGGVALLVATACTEAAGYSSAANVLAEYVFLLLGGGVILLLVEPFLRNTRPSTPPLSERPPDAEEHPPDPAEQGNLSSQQALDHLEQQPVAFVDAAGGHDDQQEQSGDPEGENR